MEQSTEKPCDSREFNLIRVFLAKGSFIHKHRVCIYSISNSEEFSQYIFAAACVIFKFFLFHQELAEIVKNESKPGTQVNSPRCENNQEETIKASK